eukprot:5963033-Pyramimonas_sp.AAC.1
MRGRLRRHWTLAKTCKSPNGLTPPVLCPLKNEHDTIPHGGPLTLMLNVVHNITQSLESSRRQQQK